MPTMQDVRAKFPQYNDMSDGALADALHRKFYSDMPRGDFDAKIGLSAAPPDDGQRFDKSGIPIGGNANVVPEGDMRPGIVPAGPQRYGGTGMNVTAGMNEALYGVAGLPMDAMRGRMNIASRGINAATGANLPQIPENSFGGSRSIGEAMGSIDPRLDPQNTIAETGADRFARGVGTGMAGTALPAAIVGAMGRMGALSPQAAQTGGQIFGRSTSTGAAAGDAAVGAVAGGGAAVGAEVSPEGYGPLGALFGGLGAGMAGAGMAALPGIAREGVRSAGRYLDPITEAGQQRVAAQRFQEAAQGGGGGDPRAFDAPGFSTQEFIDQLPGASRELVPGCQPTTFQATGNMGLGALERAAQTQNPVPFQQRRADQNAARVGAMGEIQPKGSPEAVAATVRQRLAAIEAESDSAIEAATQAARGAAERLGRGMRPDEAGTTMRGSLETARASAKAQERALWEAVDPDGTLALGATNTRQQVTRLRKEMTPSAQPLSAPEAQIYDAIGGYRGTISLREVRDLQSNLKTAMRNERMANGESTAYRRMSMVNGAIQRDFDAALAGKVAQEADAVAAGRMSPEQTIEANLNRWVESWGAERAGEAIGFDGAAGNRGSARGAAPGLGRLSGAAGEAGGRFGRPSGDQGLQSDGLQPSFDEAALGRLNAAQDATRNRAQTFDNSTLAPIRRRPATNAPYEMPASSVGQRVFFPQPRSAEAIGQFRAAVGDEQALPALQGYAIDRLRNVALREDGTFDPRRLEQWRRMHRDALRSFPELDASIADAGQTARLMGEVAAGRKQAADAAQIGILGNLIRVDAPEDVTRTIGGIFGRQDSMQRLAQVKRAIGDNAEAQQGLRKATANYISGRFIGNTEAATSGVGTIKADQLQSFVRQNRAALEGIFTKGEVEAMDAIARDFQRANRSLNAVRVPGQSNTAQDSQSMLQRIIQASSQNREAIGGAAFGGSVGGVPGALVGGVGASVLSGMRQSGLQTVDDLIRDALLDPAKARMLLMRLPDEKVPAFERTLAQRYRASAVGSAAEAESERRKGMTEVTVTPLPEDQRAGGR